jgi:hypothetical protein
VLAASLLLTALVSATCWRDDADDAGARLGAAKLLGDVTQVFLDFGQAPVGAFSVRRFHIVNIGTGLLLGQVASSCSAFVVVKGAEPYLILPADSLEVAVEFRPDSIGVFACSLSTGGRCPPVDAFGIGIPPSTLTCAANAMPTTGRVPLPVNFFGTALGASGNESYLWTFGTGDSAFVKDPFYVFNAIGNFEVVMTVFDGPPPPQICRDTVFVNVSP